MSSSNITRQGSEILVVGAGPTGLTVACELLRHGVACRVIDAATGPSATSKAFAIHSRSLEVFDDMGIATEMIDRGHPVRAMNIWLENRRFAAVDFSQLDAPYPYVLSLPQAETEFILGELLKRLGGKIEWQTKLEAIHNEDSGVAAQFQYSNDRIERKIFPWVVACDGAHSATRKLLSIPFHGSTYETQFIVADGRLDWDGPREDGSMFMNAKGYVMVFPFAKGKLHRVVLSNATGVPATLDNVHRLLGERGLGQMRVSDIVWLSNARIHGRIVDAYRKGRVFLAGDAAHIHSPVGGQGLNTGIQDAYNLAWKLACVHQGKACEDFLHSYETERRPVAAAVLHNTEKLTQVLTVRNPIKRALRKWLGPALTSTQFVRRRIAYTMSGLNTEYAKGPFTRDDRARLVRRSKGPAAGQRAPDVRLAIEAGANCRSLFDLFRGTHYTLLLFPGSSPSSDAMQRLHKIADAVVQQYGADIQPVLISRQHNPQAGIHAIADPGDDLYRRYGMKSEGLCLVRPDGYVGYRSAPIIESALQNYLGKVLKQAAVP